MKYQVIIAALVIAVTAQATAAVVIVEDRAVHAVERASLAAQLTAVHAMAGRDDSAGLLTSLQAANSDQSMNSVLRDYVLETTIFALSETTPTTAARAAVSVYQTRAVSSFVRLGDEHGMAVVPLYDIAAAARLTMRTWDTFDARLRVAGLLRTRNWTPDNFLSSPPGLSEAAWQAGTLQAIESADVRLLVQQKAALLRAFDGSKRFGTLSLSMAERLSDGEMFRAVFDLADSRVALDAIDSVAAIFAPYEATEILYAAAARTEIASAAILALGKFAANDAAVRSWLFGRLADTADGGSAALALARVATDDIWSEIESIIKSDATELTKLRAILVLRLSDTDAARAVRADLLTQQLSSEKLREALR